MPPENSTNTRYEYLSAVIKRITTKSGYYNVTVHGVNGYAVSVVGEMEFNAITEPIHRALKTMGYNANKAAANLIINSGGDYDNLVLTVLPIR